MDWTPHLRTDPAVMWGSLCVRGTRVPVTVVLANLAAGMNEDEMLESYPSLTRDGIRASAAYASELIASERVVLVTP